MIVFGAQERRRRSTQRRFIVVVNVRVGDDAFRRRCRRGQCFGVLLRLVVGAAELLQQERRHRPGLVLHQHLQPSVEVNHLLKGGKR